MPTPLDDWFADEILVHEEALLHFLARAWPQRDELHDLRSDPRHKQWSGDRCAV